MTVTDQTKIENTQFQNTNHKRNFFGHLDG
jgi:hypothetical protein